ncbi:14647_t:CDS:2, partial [Gigaspora rosea]
VGNFMKDIGQKIKVKLSEGILTNHTDADVPEDAIMNFTGHKSVQGVCAYKSVNEHQQINTIKTLIGTIELSNIEPLRNSNKINQVSSTIPEITGLHVNSNTNNVAQDINIVQEEFQNKRSIFNNCHFTNITFHF